MSQSIKMKATYRISEQDYVNAMDLFAKFTPRALLVYGLVVTALVFLSFFGTQVLSGGAIGGLIGGLSVVVIGRYIISPILVRRHYRNYKALHQEFVVEIVSDGVRFTSPTVDGKITWDQVHKWRQDDRFILIYPMPRIFHMVPKSIASQGFDLKALTDGLMQHVGKSS